MSCDLEDFFLETLISRAEYMRIHAQYFPSNIREPYNIDGLIAEDSYIYIKIIKVMYVLRHSLIIVYNKLNSNMDPHDYYPVPFKNVLWAPKTKRTNFFSVLIIPE